MSIAAGLSQNTVQNSPILVLLWRPGAAGSATSSCFAEEASMVCSAPVGVIIATASAAGTIETIVPVHVPQGGSPVTADRHCAPERSHTNGDRTSERTPSGQSGHNPTSAIMQLSRARALHEARHPMTRDTSGQDRPLAKPSVRPWRRCSKSGLHASNVKGSS